MSWLAINQDWESDTVPFALSGTIARSTTNAITGTDLRGGNGTATDGYAVFASLPNHQVPALLIQSQSFIRVDYMIEFKIVMQPAGGVIDLMKPFSTDSLLGLVRLHIPDGQKVIRSTIDTASATGATLLGTTAHIIQGLLTIDSPAGTQQKLRNRVWLDGASTAEIDHSDNAKTTTLGASIKDFNIQIGVSAAAKCTWELVFGRYKVWVGVDPQ